MVSNSGILPDQLTITNDHIGWFTTSTSVYGVDRTNGGLEPIINEDLYQMVRGGLQMVPASDGQLLILSGSSETAYDYLKYPLPLEPNSFSAQFPVDLSRPFGTVFNIQGTTKYLVTGYRFGFDKNVNALYDSSTREITYLNDINTLTNRVLDNVIQFDGRLYCFVKNYPTLVSCDLSGGDWREETEVSTILDMEGIECGAASATRIFIKDDWFGVIATKEVGGSWQEYTTGDGIISDASYIEYNSATDKFYAVEESRSTLTIYESNL